MNFNVNLFYDISINHLSKMLQNPQLNIPIDLNGIKNLKDYFCNYNKDSSLLESAKNLCKDLVGEQHFKTNIQVKKRKIFQYEHNEGGPQSPEEIFKINIFYSILDITRSHR